MLVGVLTRVRLNPKRVIHVHSQARYASGILHVMYSIGMFQDVGSVNFLVHGSFTGFFST